MMCETRSGDVADYSYQDAAEVGELCEKYRRMVFNVVNRNFLSRIDAGVVRRVGGEQEFWSEGMVALLYAARRYQKSLGWAFSTYLVNAIISRIRSMMDSKLLRNVETAWLSEMASGSGENEGLQQFDVAEVRGPESEQSEIAIVSKSGEYLIFRVAHIRELCGRLSKIEAAILDERLRVGRTLAEVAANHGMCRERVRQIQKEAVAKIGVMLGKKKGKAKLSAC